MRKLKFPKIATAPFCPSEVQGSVVVSQSLSLWQRLLIFIGPGLLVAVGYVDPGNWATDIEAGSKYGYDLLWVVLASSLAAIFLQTLSLRLGLVAQKDLAQLCRKHYGKKTNAFLWVIAELSIIACDIAEVLGTALALHLLLGVSLPVGIAITAFDTVVVLGLKGRGFRQIEAIVLGLLITVGACFVAQIIWSGPEWGAVFSGFIPSAKNFSDAGALYLAVGILGATIMPHNLYLHSSIVQTRKFIASDAACSDALRLSTLDTFSALMLALIMNAAILIVAAAAFHGTGHTDIHDIDDAYRLLGPIVGNSLAPIIFGIGLLASGQSSTFTGTIAGQVIMEGFLNLKIPCWQRRLVTRTLALVPAFVGIMWLGEQGVGKLLVASQVVLSMQLPFAMWPLIRFTSSKKIMKKYRNNWAMRIIAVLLFAVITSANAWLLFKLLAA